MAFDALTGDKIYRNARFLLLEAFWHADTALGSP